jgi:hypothetical protein
MMPPKVEIPTQLFKIASILLQKATLSIDQKVIELLLFLITPVQSIKRS